MFSQFCRLVRFVSMRRAILLFLPAVLVPGLRTAEAQQEQPYFVTYSSQLEEPGNLEIESQNVAASPANANAFFAPTLELEYGATAWWTAEVYLQGQELLTTRPFSRASVLRAVFGCYRAITGSIRFSTSSTRM